MELLERDEDLGRLEALLKQAATGEGSVVLLEGEAGIGKTSLLKALDRLALQQGFTVLRARGAQLEQDFPHGIVRQLFEPLVRRADDEIRARVFRGAAALAAPVVGLDGSSPGRMDPSFAANHGLYWLTVEVSDLAPLCLLVDDVHWADPASLAYLDYLARRIEELPILLLGVVRTTDPGSGLVDDLRQAPGVERVEPSLLTHDGTAALVQELVREAPPQEFVDACHEATRGNPFFVEELLRALPSGSLDAAAVGRMGPPTIARAVLGRLAQLWPEALAVARAVAVLDVDAEPRHVAAVGAVDEPIARRMADALVGVGLLTAGRGGLRFRHPILRRAVYDDIGPLELAELHRRAANALEVVDADRAAVHMLSSGPAGDPCTVGRLRDAAARALGRGAPAAASRLLRRALDEPPTPGDAPALLLELGRAARLAGEPDAMELLTRALVEGDDPEVIAGAAEEIGLLSAFFDDLDRGLRVLEEAVDRLPPGHPAAARILTTAAVVSAWYDETAVTVESKVFHAAAEADERTEPGRLLISAALLHAVHGWGLDLAGMSRLLEKLEGQPSVVEASSAAGPSWIGPAAALAMTSVRGYEALLDRAMDHAAVTGSRTQLATHWLMRATVGQYTGDLGAMEECARRTLEVAPAVGTLLRYQVGSTAGLSLVCRGLFADAADLLRDLGILEGEVGSYARGRTLLAVRAHLKAQTGQLPEALADARELARRQDAYDRTFMPFGSVYSGAIALHVAGAHEEAVAEAERELAIVRRLRSPVVEGVALLVRGSITGDLEDLHYAVGALEGAERLYDLARARTEYGAALRRHNQRATARHHLERGMELAHRLGAVPLVERARQELLATGARPRRLVVTGVDALTASERRVASMAADGLTNTEIAQALFVTRKTVEKHLGGAFQKLGISSRTQLAEALGEPAKG